MVPFPSEEARRQAWFDHRDQLMAEALEIIPEAVVKELLLRPKYRGRHGRMAVCLLPIENMSWAKSHKQARKRIIGSF